MPTSLSGGKHEEKLMTEFKAIFEPSESSTANWPSHCLNAENWQDARDEAKRITPPDGAGVLKILVDGNVRDRLTLRRSV